MSTVTEIQEALRFLSFIEPAIPSPVIDGVYGFQTRRAVEMFQRLYNLPVTGQTDPVTWDRLQDAFEQTTPPIATAIRVFPDHLFTVSPGESPLVLPIIKEVLRAVTRDYTNIPTIGDGLTYDKDTVNVVRYLRHIHDLEENDLIDYELWEIIATLYNDGRASEGREIL